MRQLWTGTGPAGYIDWQYPRQVGTNPWECWYAGGAGSEYAMETGAYGPTVDVLYSVPFFAPRGGTLDRIAIYVGTAAAQKLARLGIYNSTTQGTNLYPSSLLLDAGAVSVNAVGLASIVIAQALTPNTLYWLSMVHNDNTGALRIYALCALSSTYGFQIPCLGLSGANTTQDYLSVAQAYGALPNPHPAAATLANGWFPSIAVRYSA